MGEESKRVFSEDEIPHWEVIRRGALLNVALKKAVGFEVNPVMSEEVPPAFAMLVFSEQRPGGEYNV